MTNPNAETAVEYWTKVLDGEPEPWRDMEVSDACGTWGDCFSDPWFQAHRKYRWKPQYSLVGVEIIEDAS
jgi:hypothetical protein